MMATVPHVTSGLGLRKFQADGFLLTRVYLRCKSLAVLLAVRWGQKRRVSALYPAGLLCMGFIAGKLKKK